MNPVNPALLDSSLQYGALGILGAVMLIGAGIVLAMTRAMLKSFADQRDAMHALIRRIDADTRTIATRIDTAERAITDNLNTTRHAMRNVATGEHGETRELFTREIQALRERMHRTQ